MTYRTLQRTLVLTLLAATCGQGWSQEIGASFDYSCSAQPIRKALAEISVLAKTKLYVDSPLEDEPIVLKLHAVTVDSLMQKLSLAMEAGWRKSNDGMELWRSPEQWESLKRHGLEVRATQLSESIKRTIAPLKLERPFDRSAAATLAGQVISNAKLNDQDWATASRLESQMPVQRALWKIVSRMAPKEIAELELGERVVWSNTPNAAQKNLEINFPSVAEEFAIEQNLLASEISPADSQVISRLNYGIPLRKLAKAPARFVLAAFRTLLGDDIKLTLICYDDTKAPVSYAEAHLQVISERIISEHARAALNASKELPIKVTELGRAQLSFIRQSVVTNNPQLRLGPGLFRDAVLSPETIDPLAGIASDAFIGMADDAGENLVFYPDDTAFLVALYAGMEGELKPSVVRQSVVGIGQISPIQIKEDGAWMVAAPEDLLQAYRGRTDRHALGEFLRRLDRDRYSSISSAAQLVTSMRGNDFSTLSVFITLLIDGDAQPGRVGSYSALKFFGSLDPSQLEWLRTGNKIRLADMDSSQAALVGGIVYNQNVSDETFYPGPNDDFVTARANKEVTELYPNGLSQDTTVSGTWSERNVFLATMDRDGAKYSQVMDLRGLALNLVMIRRGEEPVKRRILGVSPAILRSVAVLINAGRGIEGTVLQETEPSAGPMLKIESLPEDIRKQLDKEIAKIEGSLPPAPETAKPQAPPSAA